MLQGPIMTEHEVDATCFAETRYTTLLFPQKLLQFYDFEKY
jgi:hypothetical protein